MLSLLYHGLLKVLKHRANASGEGYCLYLGYEIDHKIVLLLQEVAIHR